MKIKFEEGNQVEVTKPVISGTENWKGRIISIDTWDEILPIRILFPNGQVLYFNEKELTLIP